MKHTYLIFLAVFLVACNGARSVKVSVNSTNTVNASSANIPLTSCKELNRANTTYTLLNDVSSDGTCFTITAPHVVLNLNGHAVIYDNRAPVKIVNGDFETKLSDSWDISNAPNSSRALGTFVQPVTLYSGAYSLRFALPFTGVQYVRSSKIQLSANTTYSISAMFRNSGNNEIPINTYVGGHRDPIVMSIELEDVKGAAYQKGVTWRGFQYTNFIYTTGENAEERVIRITVNHVPIKATGYVYVDDVKVLKTPSYGVHVGTNYKPSKHVSILNGVISQGQGAGFASHAIKLEESAGDGFNISDLSLTTHGVNSRPFFSYYANNAKIINNVINNNTITIKSRDAFDGASIYIPYESTIGTATIYSNKFDSGIQTAIYIKSSRNGQHKIVNNSISLQSKYTNDFAIVAGGSEVRDNIVNCDGVNNSCRGITIGGRNSKIINNKISVQQLSRNQEYNGCQAAGAYGMQGEYGAENTEVYGNMVKAITGASGVCEAAALRLNPDIGGTTSINIHDNTFIAISTGRSSAYAMKFANIYGNGIRVDNNIFMTNRKWLYLDYDQSPSKLMRLVMSGNTFKTYGSLDSPFNPFLTAGGVHGAFTFINNNYGVGDKERFESEYFRISGKMNRDPLSKIQVIYTGLSDQGD